MAKLKKALMKEVTFQVNLNDTPNSTSGCLRSVTLPVVVSISGAMHMKSAQALDRWGICGAARKAAELIAEWSTFMYNVLHKKFEKQLGGNQ